MVRTVVVVGGGNAGMPAAIEAADRRARVIIIEKRHELGGMLHWSSATMSAAGARMQLAKGITNDSPQQHFDDCVRIGRNRNDPELLRLAVENAAESIDWLESINVPYTEESPRFSPEHELYSIPRSYYPNQPGPVTTGGFRGGGIIYERLNTQIEQRAAAGSIDVRLNTSMTGLVIEDGEVRGVTVEGISGTEAVRGDVVILTTGGYMANQQLMQELHPGCGKLVTLCGPHAAGEAIPMVQAAGGYLVNMDLLIPLAGFVEDPENEGYARPATTLMAGRPPGIAGDIWVNTNGERFIAEDQKSPDARERAIMAQPDWLMYAIFDDLMRQGFTKEISEFTRTKLAHIGLIISAPTIEELAEKLGIPRVNLRRTVEEYNAAVEAGSDRFGRQGFPKAIEEGPFHAVRSDGVTILSQGGIKVNARLQVVRPDGSPIPNLYAAGEVIGAGQVMGDAFCSGMSAGAAVTTGRLAVRSALGLLEPIPA